MKMESSLNLVVSQITINLDGFMLPTAIPQCTTVQLGFSNNGQHHFYSVEFDKLIRISNEDAPPEGFASYIFGCIRLLEKQGHTISPLNLHVTSSVPIGCGLSSSAALEVATLRGLRSLFSLSLDDVQIAQLGQQAEIQYAGLNCGIMDQMAASLAGTDSMLFLDTPFHFTHYPLPITHYPLPITHYQKCGFSPPCTGEPRAPVQKRKRRSLI